MISIITDNVTPSREQSQSSTHTSYYKTRTASRTRQSMGSETQHIALDTKGNPFFVNKSGNTIIIVEYTFVMMSYALIYLKYFSLTIQVREECHEVVPGEEEVLEAVPLEEAHHTVPESKHAVKQLQRKICCQVRMNYLILCHVKYYCTHFKKCKLHREFTFRQGSYRQS